MKKASYLIFSLFIFLGCRPAVQIVSPTDGAVFDFSEPITFVGFAIDFKDGPLVEESLAWTSNLDGEVGIGTTIFRNDLTEGTHIITLNATNSQKVIGIATISITIEEGANMVLIPAGEFEMGCQDDECADDELPVHEVFLNAFLIDKYELTNYQYASFLNIHGNNCDGYRCCGEEEPFSRIKQAGEQWIVDSGYEDHPVNYVTWYGARAYCEVLGKRLPTEAEWELASRGTLDGEKYPWGDMEPDCTYANFYGCLNDTSSVGSYSPNDYGLYDMAGNVWEWVNDWYDFYYYQDSPHSNPSGPESGLLLYRILRGGGLNSISTHLRSAQRDRFPPDYHYWNGVGFRCVKESKE